jgi:hypothetical protein
LRREHAVERGDSGSQALGREVRVAQRHRQRLVPEQIFHLLETSATLNERMTQIVKAEVLDPGRPQRRLPG